MKIPWHRLFGLLLMDYLSTRGFCVELEKDLSLKRQYLDVVIVEQVEGKVDLAGICDGFDNLGPHNLLSYKSLHQSLNAWALEELIGHYVNYRKILGRKQVRGRDIRLYAVCTRHPRQLLSLVKAVQVRLGVWEASVLSRTIRILVLNEMSLAQRNAVLAFFTFDAEKVRYALHNYEWQQGDGSTVVNQLLNQYALEGIGMPYTMEQFRKDYLRAHISELPPDEVMAKFDPDIRLKGLNPEDRLKGLDPEDRLKGLDPQEIFPMFDPEDRLKGLDPDVIEAYLRKVKKNREQ
jgi:hypothetical protein